MFCFVSVVDDYAFFSYGVPLENFFKIILPCHSQSKWGSASSFATDPTITAASRLVAGARLKSDFDMAF